MTQQEGTMPYDVREAWGEYQEVHRAIYRRAVQRAKREGIPLDDAWEPPDSPYPESYSALFDLMVRLGEHGYEVVRLSPEHIECVKMTDTRKGQWWQEQFYRLMRAMNAMHRAEMYKIEESRKRRST